MKDQLTDIVKNLGSLGVIDLIKVTGTDSETTIDGMATDKTVVIKGKFKTPVDQFSGVFGLSNLANLKTILDIPEYKEDAEITILTADRDGEKTPTGLRFKNKAGDFQNEYRFMVADVVNDKLKNVKFKGAGWNVTVNPTAQNIQRMKFQSAANNNETTFIAKTDGSGNLVFYFGDSSNSAGNFVFTGGVTGSLTKSWAWPVGIFNSILSLAGDKTVMFSDAGASQITLDTGIAVYDFIIPAQQR